MPTRDEPVYVRVEGEHILGTLISPGCARSGRALRPRLGRRPAAIPRPGARAGGAGLRVPHVRFARPRADANAVRIRLARGEPARHPRGLRLSRRAAQRRFGRDRRRRQQLRRLPGGAVDGAAPGEVARAAGARAVQGLGMDASRSSSCGASRTSRNTGCSRWDPRRARRCAHAGRSPATCSSWSRSTTR